MRQISLRYQAFENLYKKYYKNILDLCGVSKASSVLEVGCNIGAMLGALRKDGYSDLYGIDLSIDDVKIAKRRLPGVKLTVGDALDPSSYAKEEFDIIMCRAVLEHIEKDKVFDFLQILYAHLREGGILIVDVPNMDWFWASHERYMDFTHNCGFTVESLDEVLLCFFDKVQFVYEDTLEYAGKKDWWKRKLAKKILWYIYAQAGALTAEENLFSRCLIAYARKSR